MSNAVDVFSAVKQEPHCRLPSFKRGYRRKAIWSCGGHVWGSVWGSWWVWMRVGVGAQGWGAGMTGIILQPLLQVTWVDQEPLCAHACC